jgi:hypothetical protein
LVPASLIARHTLSNLGNALGCAYAGAAIFLNNQSHVVSCKKKHINLRAVKECRRADLNQLRSEFVFNPLASRGKSLLYRLGFVPTAGSG